MFLLLEHHNTELTSVGHAAIFIQEAKAQEEKNTTNMTAQGGKLPTRTIERGNITDNMHLFWPHHYPAI